MALIGCGVWGKNLARNLAELGALHSVCDTDPLTREWVHQHFPDIETVGDPTEVFRNDKVEAVVIAVPASFHCSFTRQALLAGKDVFVEKPLALSVREGEELVHLAARQGRILMVGHLLEYHPAIPKLKELVDGGALGNLQYIYSNRLNLGRFRREENILWSFAPHDISVILRLLGEMPVSVAAHGGSYLHREIADVTVTTLAFRSGVQGHIFVSWLHPYKEQRLVVVGDRNMAVFDDVAAEAKLTLYPHQVAWVNRAPVPRREDAVAVEVEATEPLRVECEHFLRCVVERSRPRTDGENGLQVLRVLEACQTSLEQKGRPITLAASVPSSPRYFAHETAVIDEGCEIGEGTKIWHFSHIMERTRLGLRCDIGQNVVIERDVVIGDNVKIQNNVSVYTGVVLEDDVFCGPSMVFTNVINPRSHISRKAEYQRTLVRKGASLGANSTILCGHTIGRYAFIGAGAVVTRDAPDYALVVGNPARVVGWICQCGIKLEFGGDGGATCQKCGSRYRKTDQGVEPLS